MHMSAICVMVVQVSHNAELSPYKLDERGSLNIMVGAIDGRVPLGWSRWAGENVMQVTIHFADV